MSTQSEKLSFAILTRTGRRVVFDGSCGFEIKQECVFVMDSEGKIAAVIPLSNVDVIGAAETVK